MTELRLIDAIGPFFHSYHKRRTNWSKIVFPHLLHTGAKADKQWRVITDQSRHLSKQVHDLGYNSVTLDDLAHLTPHPWLEPDLQERCAALQSRFREIFAIHQAAGHEVFLTSDVVCVTDSILSHTGKSRDALDDFYADQVDLAFRQMPELSGLVLRIGESDGLDVKDPLRSHLHLRNTRETRRFLQRVLPVFEKHGKKLILRTWTVGAHHIGDLIWHRGRLAETFKGIDSPALIISMKHGESDFFRYLPLNRAFHTLELPKIIEFQARREYEGAGEFPCYIGWDLEKTARELDGVTNLVGLSTWCQTGGWHAFSRKPFLNADPAPEDTWVRQNCKAVIDVIHHGITARDSLISHALEGTGKALVALMRDCNTAMRDLYYVPQFARQKLFFRRVRIPPLLHVYWDCLFISSQVRKLMRFFVHDHDDALRTGEAVLSLFPRMIELAQVAQVPVKDIEFMQDTLHMIALARRYFFLPYDPDLIAEIRNAKKAYKAKWPRNQRSRYRIKTNFEPFHLKRRTLKWSTGLLLRKKRGYRIVDHIFTLNLLSLIYRLFKNRYQSALPKFVRKSAMGIDSVFK